MKIVKEIKEQYAYLWWWFLEQGIFLSALIINSFLFVVWLMAMGVFVFLMRWLSRH